MAINIRKPNAIGKASQALSVQASAKSKTSVLNANLMAQLKINFQFITTTKIGDFFETTKIKQNKKPIVSRQPVSKTNYLKTNLLKQIKKISFLFAKVVNIFYTAKKKHGGNAVFQHTSKKMRHTRKRFN